jgi:hypothetical protein
MMATPVKTNDGGFAKSKIAAADDVITTRFTEGALFLMARRRPTVPLIARYAIV